MGSFEPTEIQRGVVALRRARRLALFGALFTTLCFSAACSRRETGGASEGKGRTTALEMTSAAFAQGADIPAKYTCRGADVSPPLTWSGAPEGTKSFALICDDSDAPVGTWVHWVLYGLPPGVAALPEGVAKTGTLEDGARQGTNDFERIGYGGPCPPPGAPHRYIFTLYALNVELNLRPGAKKYELLAAMEGHILGQAQLMGRYERD